MVQEFDVVDDLATDQGVVSPEVPRECLFELGDLVAQHLAISASTFGSRSPAIRASIIARDEALHTVDATEVSLIPASWRTFSRRWISRARASTWVLRYRVISRNSRMSGGERTKADHPVCRHVGQPLGVGEIALASRHVLDVLGVAEPELFEEAFEGVIRASNRPRSPPWRRCSPRRR